jgi:COP9 signalosome complex subunit 6
MSTSIESIGIHPIVVLTISDFYNRMKVTSKGKISRVYGALMGQKIGTKVEIFYAFEFVNNSTNENKIDLDIKYIDTRRDLATQLFPKFDIVGFFSTNTTSEPNENDKQILNAMNYFGVINPIYLVLSTTSIEKEKELPVSAFWYDKSIEKFTKVRHIIEGWESERICLETVTKNTDVENEENGLVKNIQTTRNALAVLKENLILIKSNINKFKNDKKFMELVEDLIINYPAIEKSGYQALMKNKQKEILLLNNICLSTLQSSYMGLISH